MKSIIKISAVSYLNSAPFVFGIKQKLDPQLFNLELDTPSVCADKLLKAQVDIGLVPVAIIPLLKEHHIISNYGIGAVGKVRSVILYSEVPLSNIENILLDHQSRTSVLLAKVLAKKLWNISPSWMDASEGFESKIIGTTAGVVIGDRTFNLAGKFAYEYDLSEQWQKLTGLPFVFACWVSIRKLPDSFLKAFNRALLFGLDNKSLAIDQMPGLPASKTDISNYLSNSISYDLDAQKKAGMAKFLELARDLKIIL